MMDTFEEFEIEELPLGVPFFRKKVEDFLKANGLALEEVDSYLAVCDGAGEILAGGGIQRDTIKCVAVSEKARSAGLASPLISRLISLGTERGHNSIRVFTKPENRAIFESLGFHLLAQAPQAILLESSLVISTRQKELSGQDDFGSRGGRGPTEWGGSAVRSCSSGRCGIIVMNANPFTRGHRYLAEQALKRCDSLVVLVVHAEASRFSFEERFEMVRAGLADLPGVTVCDAGRDVISKEVFPTYFIKNLTEASQVQMYLDIDLFARQVAPSYCCSVRFVGSEPKDSLTAEYNKMMHEMLPERGIEVVEIPRLLAPVAADLTGSPRPQVISASSVREIIDGTFPKTPYGGLAALRELVPETTLPYVLAEMACACLTTELETPLKPGLVGPDGPGAHRDMDMQLMQRGIAAIRTWFMRIAAAGLTDAARPAEGCGPVRPCGAIPPTPWAPPVHEATGGHAVHSPQPGALLLDIGQEAEKAMLEATGGVNTHKGAIFALGIALYAAASRGTQVPITEEVMQNRCAEIALSILRNQLNNSDLRATLLTASDGVRDARVMALGGYAEVFSDWMPFYRQNRTPVRLLLRIMSTLDDTCVIHRAGRERAQQVKEEAAAMLDTLLTGGNLREMCSRYAAEGISPGGAADMMALTLLMDRLLPA